MKIIIHHRLEIRSIEIFAYTERGNDDIYYHMHEGDLVETVVPRHVHELNIKPLLILPGYMFGAFEQALIEDADKRNVKTEHHHKLEGTLQATQAHLQDLKTILFNQLKIPQR